MNVAVIGAGISGLVAAYRLQESGCSVSVFESSHHPGGKIAALTHEGEYFDLGPNTVLETNRELVNLIDALGLRSRILYANPHAATRLILKEGKLRALPLSPVSLLFGGFFSLKTKLNVLRERSVPPVLEDETVGHFFERRFGKEVVDYVINPFVAGTYASSPDELSIGFGAFKRLKEFERNHGSVMRGIFAEMKKKRGASNAKTPAPSGKMFSFPQGFSEVIERLSQALGHRLTLHCTVEEIHPSRDGVELTLVYQHQRETHRFDAVVVASPARETASFFRHDARLKRLAHVRTSPVAQVFLTYDPAHLRLPKAFGFLVPEKEQRRILGALFNSEVFPTRYRHAVVTVFIGGSRQPELALRSKAELFEIARQELHSLIPISTEPLWHETAVWREAIPIYECGHGELLERIKEVENELPRVGFCGNWRGGISVPDSVAEAERIATEMLRRRDCGFRMTETEPRSDEEIALP